MGKGKDLKHYFLLNNFVKNEGDPLFVFSLQG